MCVAPPHFNTQHVCVCLFICLFVFIFAIRFICRVHFSLHFVRANWMSFDDRGSKRHPFENVTYVKYFSLKLSTSKWQMCVCVFRYLLLFSCACEALIRESDAPVFVIFVHKSILNLIRIHYVECNV